MAGWFVLTSGRSPKSTRASSVLSILNPLPFFRCFRFRHLAITHLLFGSNAHLAYQFEQVLATHET